MINKYKLQLKINKPYTECPKSARTDDLCIYYSQKNRS